MKKVVKLMNKLFIKLKYTMPLFFMAILILSLISLNSCSNNNTTASGEFSLNLYHFNDIHTAETFSIEGDSSSIKVGGWPRLIEAISNADKGEYSEVIFAGDIFMQGYPLFVYTDGEYDYNMLCKVSPSIITLGNHELYETDTGILEKFFDYIIKNLDNCNIDIVLANVTFDNETIQNTIKPYIIKEYGNEKVAYFGLTTDESGFNDITGMAVSDPFEVAQSIIEEIKSQGVNKIVAITHIGFDRDQELATSFPDIDIIVGGHTHTLLGDYSALSIFSTESYPYNLQNTSTYIVTAGYYGLILGNINISFDEDGVASILNAKAKMLLTTDNDEDIISKVASNDNFLVIKENNEAVAETESVYSKISDGMDEVIGSTNYDLYTLKVNSDYSINDYYASSLGTLYAQSMYLMDYNKNISVDLAMVNTGALRINF